MSNSHGQIDSNTDFRNHNIIVGQGLSINQTSNEYKRVFTPKY
jgi:hypothetical protein